MILTNQCAEAFEKWMLEKSLGTIRYSKLTAKVAPGNYPHFDLLLDFVQYAYYERFFEENKIWITRVPQQYNEKISWEYGMYSGERYGVELSEYVAYQSNEEVIIAANDLFNQSIKE